MIKKNFQFLLIFSLIIIVISVTGRSQEINNNKVFLIVNKENPSTSHSIRNNTTFVSIRFNMPNHRANIMHVPESANHYEYKHDQVEVTNSELKGGTILFADELTFHEFSDLEQIGKKQSIYMIYLEDYLSKDRFVLNHYFTAYEVWVIADGPI